MYGECEVTLWLVEQLAVTAYGEWRYSSTVFIIWVRVFSCTSWPPCPLGEIHRYELDKRLNGPQNWSGR